MESFGHTYINLFASSIKHGNITAVNKVFLENEIIDCLLLHEKCHAE
jgi:hypothetical protein